MTAAAAAFIQWDGGIFLLSVYPADGFITVVKRNEKKYYVTMHTDNEISQLFIVQLGLVISIII